jgi:hypothetical protein
MHNSSYDLKLTALARLQQDKYGIWVDGSFS